MFLPERLRNVASFNLKEHCERSVGLPTARCGTRAYMLAYNPRHNRVARGLESSAAAMPDCMVRVGRFDKKLCAFRTIDNETHDRLYQAMTRRSAVCLGIAAVDLRIQPVDATH